MRGFRWTIPLAAAASLALAACGGGSAASTSPSPVVSTAPASVAASAKPSVAPSASAAASTAAVASTSAAASVAAKPSASSGASTAAVASTSAAASGAAGAKPTVKLGSFNFAESQILMELYGQALEGAGYKVDRSKANLGSREVVEPALEKGDIDLVPEYMNTLLLFLDKNQQGSGDAAADQKALQTVLTPKNLTVLDYAQAVDGNGFVVTKDTASKYNLKKMSDLAPVGNQLVLGGPPECPTRPFCQPGLKSTYGITFKDFKSLDAGGPLTVAALDANQIQVGLLFTTDATIVVKSYVLLDDDKHLQGADNVAPVVRNQLLNSAPPDFKTTLNGVSAKLTTANLTDMNKQVSIDKKDPKDVAGAFLKAQGLVK